MAAVPSFFTTRFIKLMSEGSLSPRSMQLVLPISMRNLQSSVSASLSAPLELTCASSASPERVSRATNTVMMLELLASGCSSCASCRFGCVMNW